MPLELRPGLVSDETLFSTRGAWADGDKIRFRYGRAETIGGWEGYLDTALTGVCRNALVWVDNYKATNIAFGTHSNLYVARGEVLYDITPTGLPPGVVDTVGTVGGWGTGGWGMGPWGAGAYDTLARTWSFATWGENLMASARHGTLYIWQNDVGAVATEVSAAPDTITTILIPPDSRQVRAYGCNEVSSGLFNPACIRGCDLEDYTDWTPASDNNAFEVIIEGGSPIVSAKVFADREAIWTESGVHLGTFVGQPNQKYRVDLAAVNCGLAGPNAAVVYNRTAYWLTPDLRFYVWPYGGVPVELPCPISRDFAENVDTEQAAKIVATSVGKFGEIWWFYPDLRSAIDGDVLLEDGDPILLEDGGSITLDLPADSNRYIAYHVEESMRAQAPVWSRGTLSRTAAVDSGTLLYPLMVDVSGNTFLHEKSRGADGAALDWFVESSAQYLGEAEFRNLIRGVWPDIEGQAGEVDLTIETLAWPQDASPVAYGPYPLAVGANKYDFMAEGRLVTVKYSGEAAETFARIGKPSFDVQPTGRF